MGTGKSTLGRAVAQVLCRRFTDSDAEIERRAGRSIPEIFASAGEVVFRDWETVVAVELGRPHRGVVATGGGILGRAENLAALRAGGVLVALTARPTVILRRVGGAAAARRRPLLAGGDPLERIRTLLQERGPLYTQADLTLDTGDMRRDAAVAALLRLCAECAGTLRRPRVCARDGGEGGGDAGADRAGPPVL